MKNLNELPGAEELVEILMGPDAPSRLMLDIEGSDFEGGGIIYVGLDSAGKLVELED